MFHLIYRQIGLCFWVDFWISRNSLSRWMLMDALWQMHCSVKKMLPLGFREGKKPQSLPVWDVGTYPGWEWTFQKGHGYVGREGHFIIYSPLQTRRRETSRIYIKQTIQDAVPAQGQSTYSMEIPIYIPIMKKYIPSLEAYSSPW